jgi:hypothetical protein
MAFDVVPDRHEHNEYLDGGVFHPEQVIFRCSSFPHVKDIILFSLGDVTCISAEEAENRINEIFQEPEWKLVALGKVALDGGTPLHSCSVLLVDHYLDCISLYESLVCGSLQYCWEVSRLEKMKKMFLLGCLKKPLSL